MPHQEKAIEYTKTTDHPAFLMEMRLGKTLSAIRWVQNIEDSPSNVVVLAPLTVLEAWENELKQEGEKYIVLHGKSREQKIDLIAECYLTQPPARTWLLINYESLLRLPEIAVMPWNVVILDESTRIKNPQSKTSIICTEGFRLVRHRAILTGLVAPESPLDLYQQFKFLDGSFMGCDNFWRFRSTWFLQDPYGYGYVPDGGTRER